MRLPHCTAFREVYAFANAHDIAIGLGESFD